MPHIDIREAARGRWPDILAQLGGLSSQQLTNKHQPCPNCGGEDRYRFDDLDGNGSWYCNQCGGPDERGGAGSGLDLLMRVKGWDFQTAARQVEQFLGIRRQRPDAPVRGAESVWWYTNDFAVCRFPGKAIRPLHWDGDKWKWGQPTGKRPLYNRDRLKANPDAFVLVVEGEKTADAAQRLFPSLVVTTWPGGCKATGKADWSPLSGRRVALWPDADSVGLHAMLTVAGMVRYEKLRMVRNPEGVPEGWDVADADWTPEQAAQWLRDNNYEPQLVAPAPEEADEPVFPEPPMSIEPEPLPDTGDLPFQILGSHKGRYFFLPNRCQEVLELSTSSLTKRGLCQLAPLRFWEVTFPGRTGPNWDSAMDWIIDQAQRVGVYDPSRLRGRGAWWDNDRVVLHLGNKLLIGGDEQQWLSVPGSNYIYERAISLPGFGDESLSDEDALAVLAMAHEFSWEVPASAALLAGWVVLAPFCGALEWRPHIWVTGGAGTGKSAVLRKFIRPLLTGHCHIAQASTTEAGVRSLLGSDAIPVVFDEADPSKDKDTDQMDNLLGFIRAASSDDSGSIIKGRADGGFNRFEARAMFCLASINAPVARKSDKDRFCLLSLRKGDPSKDWGDLEARLLQFITPELGKRLGVRTMKLIPAIRANARTFAAALASRYSQRFGDQCGTLVAGAYSLVDSSVVTLDQAKAWIDDMDWDSYSPDQNEADERECIQYLMQKTIVVDPSHRYQVGEIVLCAMQSGETPLEVLNAVNQNQAINLLGRHGFRVIAHEGEQYLAVANKANAIDEWLRGTRWANSHGRALKRIPGAIASGPQRFGVITQRCTLIPVDSLS